MKRPFGSRPMWRSLRAAAPQGAAGFTLLELLVVIAIFGLMSVMAYGGLSSVMKSRVRIEQSLDRTAQLQKAFQRLRDDFQQARARPVRDTYGAVQPALVGLREQRVEFTRGGWRNPLVLPRPGLERVSYRIEDGKLLRESFRVLDQAQDSKPVQLALLDEVSELHIRYLDSTREWVETWPPATQTGAVASTTAPPPLAVELMLNTKSEGDLRFLFRLGLDLLPKNFAAGQTLSPAQGTGQKGDSAPVNPQQGQD